MLQRGKTDFTTMFVWLLILAVPAVAGFWCYSNLKAVGDPANMENYWRENMYTYRADMARADQILERGDFAEAREAYQDAIDANAKNRVSIVLRDRIARAWYQEGLSQHEDGDWNRAITTFRSAIDATGQTNNYAAREQRPTNHEFIDEVTTRQVIVNAMVDSLVAEGVNLRDNLDQHDAAQSILLEAREWRPEHFGACKEVVTLFQQLELHSPYLEALRHVIDNLPGPDDPDYGQYVSDNPSYGESGYYQSTARIHGQFQNVILSTYPVEEWVPIVDGLTLHYYTVFSIPGGGSQRGHDFTRTMSVDPRNPNVGLVSQDGGAPEYIFRWENVGGRQMLVEEWTPRLSGDRAYIYHLLPSQPQMGQSWRSPDGTTFRIVDLVSDPDNEFRLVLSGYHLGNWELTYGVGRTTITPLGSDEGERLEGATYPGG